MANITVAGLGYVGTSNAIVLARHHRVKAYDVDPVRIDRINRGQSPVVDDLADKYLRDGAQLTATGDAQHAFADAEYVIVATPTNYDPHTGSFDTRSVEEIVTNVREWNPHALIVLKSTLPVGFTKELRHRRNDLNIIFSPEFLREGHAVYDNLYPSRIVIGGTAGRAKAFSTLLKQAAIKEDVPVILTGESEAEAIKLFSNTYLAMRVAFFNELDSFAVVHGLEAADLVKGASLDPRIGTHYNNPSFGYGGYCLPKDTKQLLSNFGDVPQNLMRAIIDANTTRVDFIASQIGASNPDVVGVYGLAMKAGSDNFRESSILKVVERLQMRGIRCVLFEPNLGETNDWGLEKVNDLDHFKKLATIIIANRRSPDLLDVEHKLYSRDLYGTD